MGRAYRGPYARQSTYGVPYASASIWGTGVDPIHGFYGEGPPLRVMGREGAMGSSPVGGSEQGPRTREYQNPAYSAGSDPPEELTWGYPVDYDTDATGQGPDSSPSTVAPPIQTYLADRPTWGNDVPDKHIRDTSKMPPWGVNGLRGFLAVRMGSHRYRLSQRGYYEPISAEQSQQLPNETVSEGWLNKVTSFIADAEPAADAQVFVQTSMRQRYLSKGNDRAQLRDTDDARTPIDSRVEAMVEKVYSQGERDYDMFPFQADVMQRGFRYRTAATGRQDWMQPNAYSPVQPWVRTPPADPAQGVPEVYSPSDYGYTGEDTMYYGY